MAPRELPNYRLPEAAHYLRIPQSTLRMWIFGQAYGTAAGRRRSHPIITIAADDPPRLSFVNMVEAHVLSAIRYQHGVALPAVRRAVEYLTREFGSQHPLAEEQFQTDGVNLFVERFGLLNVSAPGQFAMREILVALLRRIERDEPAVSAEAVPRHVTGDAIQIGEQPGAVRLVPRQRPYQRHEHLLGHILRGGRGSTHQTRKSIHDPTIPLIDRRERVALSRRGAPNELNVRPVVCGHRRHLGVIVGTG